MWWTLRQKKIIEKRQGEIMVDNDRQRGGNNHRCWGCHSSIAIGDVSKDVVARKGNFGYRVVMHQLYLGICSLMKDEKTSRKQEH